jgi:hypothetical protein
MNQGIYGLGGQVVTPVQGPFSGVADARKLLAVQALVVAGGGGANAGLATRPCGGGGGGGVIDTITAVFLNVAFQIVIGAGGSSSGSTGSYSRFGDFSAAPGGGAINSGSNPGYATGMGSVNASRVASVISSQGFAGGIGNAAVTVAGGGGGAGGQGVDGVVGVAAGNGGIGKFSATPAIATYYGGGGGGGGNSNSGVVSTAGVGGLGGGGTGGTNSSTNPTAGAVNTGGGGGGGGAFGVGQSGSTGGSGVVILRWNASQAVATLSSGLTFSRNTVGTDTVITITGGTGTVTFN